MAINGHGDRRWFEVPVPKVALVAITCGLVVAGSMWYRNEREKGRFDKTVRQMGALENALRGVVLFEERIPGPGLEDAIAAIRRHPFLLEKMEPYTSILNGYDA